MIKVLFKAIMPQSPNDIPTRRKLAPVEVERLCKWQMLTQSLSSARRRGFFIRLLNCSLNCKMLHCAQRPPNESFHTTQAHSSSLSQIRPSLIVILLFCHKAFAACIVLLPGFTRPRQDTEDAPSEDMSTQTWEHSGN